MLLNFLLGDVGLLKVHHVEVHSGFPGCSSDLIVPEGALKVCCTLDYFWTNDPVLGSTWDVEDTFDLGEGQERRMDGKERRGEERIER